MEPGLHHSAKELRVTPLLLAPLSSPAFPRLPPWQDSSVRPKEHPVPCVAFLDWPHVCPSPPGSLPSSLIAIDSIVLRLSL